MDPIAVQALAALHETLRRTALTSTGTTMLWSDHSLPFQRSASGTVPVLETNDPTAVHSLDEARGTMPHANPPLTLPERQHRTEVW
ncbi:MAG TPA: hypothetical protein VFF79_06480 [Conexibacter sp.]|nr:hypothetical protein [Conexibacter sp.]